MKKDTLVFIDFSKAFNSVPLDKLKQILNKKLKNAPEVRKLLEHYLDNSRIDILGKRYKSDCGIP